MAVFLNPFPPPDNDVPVSPSNPGNPRESPNSISAVVTATAGGGSFFVGLGITPFVMMSGVDVTLGGGLKAFLLSPKSTYFGTGLAALAENGLEVDMNCLSTDTAPIQPLTGAFIPSPDPRPPGAAGTLIVIFQFFDPSPGDSQIWQIAVRRAHTISGV